MDTFDAKTGQQPVANDLQEQFDALRHLVVSVLILIIVVSGTLNIFLLRVLRDSRRELAARRKPAAQVMATYTQSEWPMMQKVVARFTEFGRTNVDYAPILAKYGLKPATATSSPAASPTAAPAASTKN